MNIIEFSEFTNFIMQASSGAVGAASLWGFIFWFKGKKGNDSFKILSRKLFLLYILAFLAFFGTWTYNYFTFIPEAFAHEGIVIKPHTNEVIRGFNINTPAIALLIFSTIVGILLWMRRNLFERYGGTFYLFSFLLISYILLFGATSETFGRDQIFFWLHSWHSILTLGTILTVDMLFMGTLANDKLKRDIYPFFPIMSAAIWIGLGIDFASVFLIIDEAFHITNQFLFNQVVVGIIVLNGALLSGRINNLLIKLVKTNPIGKLSNNMSLIFGLSGSISIISWLTITFLDFVTLPFTFLQFFALYVMFITGAYLSQIFIEKWIVSKKLSF